MLKTLPWIGVALVGAGSLATIALSQGESISAAWLLTAAVCTYLIGYRFYSRIISSDIFALDATRATPAERLDDGRDFVPTNKWVVFGHHFAAIAGPGPLVGPTLAAQFAQTLDNTLAVLREANAGPEHVARMTWYITDKRAYLASLAEIGAAWREKMGRNYPAMAVVEVKALIEDAALIEIETTAVMPR